MSDMNAGMVRASDVVADPIGEWELWAVHDGGETFWMAVRSGDSAIAYLADEHDLSMEDMSEAEAERVSSLDALTKMVGDEDTPGETVTLWAAFSALVADIAAGRSAIRCVAATVW